LILVGFLICGNTHLRGSGYNQYVSEHCGENQRSA
jgi:hypothetical protein